MFRMKSEAMERKIDENHQFETPAKYVKTVADMSIWEKSEAYTEYNGFIMAINQAIKGLNNSDGSANSSPEVQKIIELLDSLDKLIDETPPIQQPQRFGNKAFREWYQKQKNGAVDLLHITLPRELHRAIPEIMLYLIDGFGNPVRIDYGTGHEISFLMFLYCLFRIGFLKSNDKVATGCKIFPRYLELARKLQTAYRMEPAGSCGVWSLDDYQFVPFIWGSSQLIGHSRIEPSSFLQQTIIDQYATDYMFIECIRYINSVKKGPFAEHSNQLWSISGVSSWSKVNAGLIKMYTAEVLGKFPVIQHIVFGTLFTLKPASLRLEQFKEVSTATTVSAGSSSAHKFSVPFLPSPASVASPSPPTSPVTSSIGEETIITGAQAEKKSETVVIFEPDSVSKNVTKNE